MKTTHCGKIIRMDWGFIDEGFPFTILPQLLKTSLSDMKYQLLQYGNELGLEELRVASMGFLNKYFGITSIDKDTICITNGVTSGIDLAGREILGGKYDSVVLEPTFDTAIESLKRNSRHVYGVEFDPFLKDESYLPQKSWDKLENILSKTTTKLLYVIPNFQNPTGIVIKKNDRVKILNLCIKYGVYLLEDDPYKLYNYENRKLPENFINLDKDKQNVIYLNSLSKVLFPGLRIGFMVSNSEIIRKIASLQKYSLSSPNLLMQGIALQAIKQNIVKQSIKYYYTSVQKKRNEFIRCFNLYKLDEICRYSSDGGFFIWIKVLNKKMNTKDEAMRAVEKGISYVPGSIYFVKCKENCYLRLAYSQVKYEDIEEYVKKLNNILRFNQKFKD